MNKEEELEKALKESNEQVVHYKKLYKDYLKMHDSYMELFEKTYAAKNNALYEIEALQLKLGLDDPTKDKVAGLEDKIYDLEQMVLKFEDALKESDERAVFAEGAWARLYDKDGYYKMTETIRLRGLEE